MQNYDTCTNEPGRSACGDKVDELASVACVAEPVVTVSPVGR